MSENHGPETAASPATSHSTQGLESQSAAPDTQGAPYDQKAEAQKAIRFLLIKAAVFILIPVIASALAIVFLL